MMICKDSHKDTYISQRLFNKLGLVKLDEPLMQKNRILKVDYEQLIHPLLMGVFGIEELFHGSIHGSSIIGGGIFIIGIGGSNVLRTCSRGDI